MRPLPISQSFRHDLNLFRRGLRLIASAAPLAARAVALLAVVEALLPAASVWLLKWIIDTAAAARGAAGPVAATRAALALAGCYLLLVALQQSLRMVSQFLQGHLNDRVTGEVTLRLMEKASAYPDLSPFESPHFHDRLQLLQREVEYRPMNLCTGLTQGGQSALTLGCMLLYAMQAERYQ